MNEKHCDHCGKPFVPREAKVRFCTSVCREEFWLEERRQAVAAYRQQREENNSDARQ
jgi:uncharacterized Zn finger protein (UPF0148 family)